MRRHRLFLLILILLTACTPRPKDPEVLSFYPLAPGTVWVYSAEISYQDPNDYQKLVTWSGTVTEKVTERKREPDGSLTFTVEKTLSPTPPPSVWEESGPFLYQISNNEVFRRSIKIAQWPMKGNMEWPLFSNPKDRAMFGSGYSIHATALSPVDTAFGKLEDCYGVMIATNPDATIDTVCAGYGIVKHVYRHHGTPQEEVFELISFTPGKP